MLRRLWLCVHESFSLLRVFLQMLYGIVRISKLQPPIVSIFGGARFSDADPYFKKAHNLARRFVESDISVLTGGGPGIMKAASCGAIVPKKSKGRVIGIGVTALGETPNKCAHEYFTLDYFFARKWLLTNYSSAFVIFPGGYGTLDEMAEVLTLIQMKRLPRVPIVLFGAEFWQPFMDWLHKEHLKHGTIDKKDLRLFTITDDIEQVFCLVRDECKVQS